MASKCNIVKAILTRVLFIMHAMVVIWRATVVKGRLYWVLTSTLGGLIFELIIVIMVNKGEEWKWFCPSVFFYLASVVPSLWLLELNRLDKLRQGLTSMNVTTTSVKLGQMELSLELSEQEWVLLIEQAMMVLLIVGRWLLPKGELTRAQLSQLLLVYLALAADMIDFFTIFGEKGAIGDKVFVYAILSGWSWSLMQFTIVLTATKSRRMRIVTPEEAPSADQEDDKEPGACGCCETELWSILMTTFMQDGPYFVLRMVALAYYRVFSYSILFFTCKNGMILLLQLYRLIVTSVEMRQKKREAEERRKLKGLGSCETLRKLSLVGDKYIRERSNDSGNSSVVG